MSGRAAVVLLVEDSQSDVRLVKEAIVECDSCVKLHVVRDGEEAMEFLMRKGGFSGAPRPDIVLLDLNLPRKDGREVLREIKSCDAIKSIPVIVLSTSTDCEDVTTCYQLGASCYITKPGSVDRFIAMMRQIEEFWLDLVTLPPGNGPHSGPS